MTARAIKGMNDILPGEVRRWQRLEQTFVRHMELSGFSEVRTPILEATELFVHQIGEATDVVEKEMYTFARGDESFTLRPEGTAGAARAYVQYKQHVKEPVSRWYYIGPMFRAERPQRGRYRQFYQAGAEIFGDPGPGCDAEMIDQLVGFFRDLGLKDLMVHVNCIGSADTRQRYRQALLEFLTPRQDQLSDHARARLEKNPLRILDSKDERDQRACQGAPSILDILSDEDQAHWRGLQAGLDALGTPYQIDATLVRGLDYYTRTLFELKSGAGELGAQNTLVGGGRYDGMVKSLGGPAVPAIGYAMGLERILLALGDALDTPPPALCYVAPLGERATLEALKLGREVRRLGQRTEVDARGNSLKSMLRRADSMGARVCLVLGDAELDQGTVQLKDLLAHSQEPVPLDSAARVVADRLRGGSA